MAKGKGKGLVARAAAAAAEVVESLEERADAWTNAYTGMGVLGSDTGLATRPVSSAPYTDAELDALFNDDHIAHKICTCLPDDGLREWCKLTIDDDTDGTGDEILEFLDDIGARSALAEGLVWARQSGGCLLVLGVDDGRPEDRPIDVTRVRSFTYVNVVRSDEASVHRHYTDARKPKYNQPEIWKLKSQLNGQSVFVHESRVIWLRGELTTPKRREERNGWDMSSLQRAKPSLARNAESWNAMSSLLKKSNLLVFGVKGYSVMVKTLKDALEAFQNRMAIARMAQSTQSWTIKDADGESVENVSVNFGSVPDVMDRQMMDTSSAADMPVTKLWGRSPAGMNATGESDLQLWDAQVKAYQIKRIKEPLETLIYFAMLTPEFGAMGADEDLSWSIAFNPLRAMTSEQKATVQGQTAMAVGILIEREVVTPEEVTLGPLFADGGLFADLAAVDTEAREAMLAAELERMVEQAKNPPEPPVVLPGNQPSENTNEPGSKPGSEPGQAAE